LAIALALVGVLNILDGLRLPLTELRQIRSLNGLAESLSALGGPVQILLGLMLVLAGAGLLWRVVSAWTLSVLLLVITVGVNRSPGTMGVESRPPGHPAGCLVEGEASLQAPDGSGQPCVLVEQHRRARNTAEELKQRGVACVQIVAAKAGTDAPGHRIIEGDATNDAVLQQAVIQHARRVIAAREDDGENAFIALAAKDLNPNVRVLAVASSALSIRKLKLARADLVFSPAAVDSRLLADLVEGKQSLPEFQDLLEGHPKTLKQMKISPLAGKPADQSALVNVPRFITSCYAEAPDASVPAQQVGFGTSGHRGTAFNRSFNEGHILAIRQAVCLYRERQGTDGPLFLGSDT